MQISDSMDGATWGRLATLLIQMRQAGATADTPLEMQRDRAGNVVRVMAEVDPNRGAAGIDSDIAARALEIALAEEDERREAVKERAR